MPHWHRLLFSSPIAGVAFIELDARTGQSSSPGAGYSFRLTCRLHEFLSGTMALGDERRDFNLASGTGWPPTWEVSSLPVDAVEYQ